MKSRENAPTRRASLGPPLSKGEEKWSVGEWLKAGLPSAMIRALRLSIG